MSVKRYGNSFAVPSRHTILCSEMSTNMANESTAYGRQASNTAPRPIDRGTTTPALLHLMGRSVAGGRLLVDRRSGATPPFALRKGLELSAKCCTEAAYAPRG
jgi:hypothetical protein